MTVTMAQATWVFARSSKRKESLSFYKIYQHSVYIYIHLFGSPECINVHKVYTIWTSYQRCLPTKRHWTFKPRVYSFVIHTKFYPNLISIKFSRHKAQIYNNKKHRLCIHSTWIHWPWKTNLPPNKIIYILFYIHIKGQLEFKTERNILMIERDSQAKWNRRANALKRSYNKRYHEINAHSSSNEFLYFIMWKPVWGREKKTKIERGVKQKSS